ncbi:MAG: PilZ domain-containing protein [Acidobacteriota bacterium]
MAVAYLETGRNLLLTGLRGPERGRVDASLAPYRHQFTDAPDGDIALRLTSRTRYDALIVSHPLQGAPLGPFLRTVRAPDSPCRRAGLVLVTPETTRQAAEAWVGRGANRVLALEDLDARLPEVLGPLLRVGPRVPLRAAVRLEVVGRDLRRVFCESVNVSESGMLLRVPFSLPPGTELRFELFAAGARPPLRGFGRVVRQTRARVEPFPGIGVTFAGFAGDDGARFQDCLGRLVR